MHKSVLLQELVAGLSPRAGQTMLDGTVGGGGHSKALCEAMGEGTILCLDEDEDAINRSRERLSPCGCKFLFSQTNFRNLDHALDSFGIKEINGAIFDLGLSSFQLDTSAGEIGRGFSFQRDEPLRMTFRKSDTTMTAREIVNDWEEENIATIIFSYGEEPQSRKIARAIAEERKKRPIKTSKELADLILKVVPRRGKIHPATKTFQALRITVNDEVRALEEALPKAFGRLTRAGKMAVISFHSIEDRIVKRFFKELAAKEVAKILTKKPITPGRAETMDNPRARSAKLRIIEKN